MRVCRRQTALRRALLTGGTGLLGSVLLAELLARNFLVTVVARSRGDASARERVRRILRAAGIGDDLVHRVDVVDASLEGGLRAGLSTRPPPDVVLHAAAAVKFNTRFADLLQQNVAATEELLALLDESAPGAEFHFVSTAYVGGRDRGTLRESDRDLRRKFHHVYEETKLLAERAVVSHCGSTARRFSIYRPSIIAGSSRDGRAANFNGIYSFLRPLDTLARLAAPPVPESGAGVSFCCDPLATKNIVAVDWVASSIAALVVAGARGKTYHLTHPCPIAHVELLDLVRQLPGVGSLDIRLANHPADLPTHRAQRLLQRALRGLEPYLWGEPRFDRTNLEEALGPAAQPPAIDLEYLARLFDFGRRVNWCERPYEQQRSDVLAAALPGNPVAGQPDLKGVNS